MVDTEGLSASTTALIAAGKAPVGPDSPPPLAPMGFELVGIEARAAKLDCAVGPVKNDIGTL